MKLHNVKLQRVTIYEMSGAKKVFMIYYEKLSEISPKINRLYRANHLPWYNSKVHSVVFRQQSLLTPPIKHRIKELGKLKP